MRRPHGACGSRSSPAAAFFLVAVSICAQFATGNTKNFGADLLETLLKMAPTKEEEIKLRDFKEETSPNKIGPAEKFLKAVLHVPFAFKRVDAMLYNANFESEVNYLKNNFDTLEVLYRASLAIHATEFWHILGISGKASHGIHATESPHSVGEKYIRCITMDLLQYPESPITIAKHTQKRAG